MKLAEVGNIEVEAGSEATEREVEQGEIAAKASGPWQAEFRVPESCVDWHEMEGMLSR